MPNSRCPNICFQTRNPHAVQPHLRKCFDAITKLEFGTKSAAENEEEQNVPRKSTATVLTTDIMAMISPEGERVELTKGLKARGNVEIWLGKVEEAMFSSLRRIMKKSVSNYENQERKDWVLNWPNQIVLSVSQIMWSREVHKILDGSGNKEEQLKAFHKDGIAVRIIWMEIIYLFWKI